MSWKKINITLCMNMAVVLRELVLSRKKPFASNWRLRSL